MEGELAHYSFVREEGEGEVRLLFGDVPADEVARAFRAAGASLITLAGERAGPGPGLGGSPEAPDKEEAEGGRGRKRKRTGAKPLGALSMRYFYALGEIVYTITITSTGEVVASVAPIFPEALLCERELNQRMAVTFRRPPAYSGPC